MTDIAVPTQVKVAAFAQRNSNQQRIEDDEAELKRLEEEHSKPTPAPVAATEDDGPEPEGAEEKTFKKRYGDLRRHSQKMQLDMQKQLDDMRSQLEQTASKEMKLPTSEDDLAQWMQNYPDVARIVETIAMKKAKEQSAGLEDRFKKIDQMEKDAEKQRAEEELSRLHPDFDRIKDDDAFHEWVEQQPKWIQQALYDNDTDALAAARAIDLYKVDKNIKQVRKTDNDKEAARNVNTRSGRTAPVANGGDGMIYESQVEKMTIQQYEAAEKDINDAMRKGKFVYDVSGNAR